MSQRILFRILLRCVRLLSCLTNLRTFCRELSEVKAHDKEVTAQANTAQDEVSTNLSFLVAPPQMSGATRVVTMVSLSVC